jgi:hypothetical protein
MARASGKSEVRVAGPSFRSEIEGQLLEIQDAFCLFVDDAERQSHRALDRLREMARQKRDIEDRLRMVERQKQDAEDQLRTLKKTPAVRIIRFLMRLNPLRSARERIH